MNDNEELIEETRERLRTGLNPGGRQVYGPDDEARMRRLADALEAAEKAHTPTDDEREALIQEWSDVHQGPDAHAVLLEMLPIGDQMSIALRDALQELAEIRRSEVQRRRIPKRLVNQLRRASGVLEEFEFEGLAGDAAGLMNSAADLIEREWMKR